MPAIRGLCCIRIERFIGPGRAPRHDVVTNAT